MRTSGRIRRSSRRACDDRGVRALAVVLLLGGVALSADHPDLSGAWTLDLNASDSVDEIMKAQGQSWIMRRAP